MIHHRRFGMAVILLGAVSLLVSCGGGSTPAPGTDWNLLLISIDALRPDHLGCHGYTRPVSPSIDRLAIEGVRFEHALSQSPHTHASLASLLTGTYPLWHDSVVGSRLLGEEVETLAELLEREGYATRAVVQNYWISRPIGFHQGFQRFESLEVRLTEPAVEKDILDWLQEARRDPFFLWLHYLEPHADYVPDPAFLAEILPEYRGPMEPVSNSEVARLKSRERTLDPERLDYIRACYDSEIRRADASVGRILNGLRDAGLTERTLVVLLSDHGEEFKDHGSMGHDHSLYQELLHVPLILRAPGILQPDRRIAELVECVDVLPTILAFLGVSIPAHVQGQDLLPLLMGWREPEAGIGFAQRYFYTRDSHLLAVVRPPWKMIAQVVEIDRDDFHAWSPEPSRCNVHLYDLSRDPRELRSIAPLHPAILMERFQELQAWHRAYQRTDLEESVDEESVDPRMRESLRSLGYLQGS